MNVTQSFHFNFADDTKDTNVELFNEVWYTHDTVQGGNLKIIQI